MSELDRRAFLERLSIGMGIVLAPGTAAALLSGCRPEAGSRPEFLTSSEFLLVGDLAERIIPETDTPGARAAGVPLYVDMLLAHFSEPSVQAEVRSQLGFLQLWLSSQRADRIDHLAPELATGLMESLDQQAFPAEGDGPLAVQDLPAGETPLLRRLKPWVIAGYYTSEVGALQELHQPPMGAFRGDVPMSEIGKTWA